MKANKYIAGFLALFAAQSASALTFEITGATAFRRATIESLHALYTAGGDFRFAHNKTAPTDYVNADYINFEGTISGLPGTTVVRCSFNGSIEGLRALAEPGSTGISGSNGDAYYIKYSSMSGALAPAGTNVPITVSSPVSGDSDMERATAEMAFSDTDFAISPYSTADLTAPLGSPGAVVFALVNSQGGGITNVTYQQYNSLLSNGFVPKSFFTGMTGDLTKRVFCTGRNDGSGTRSSYLSEMGYGVANPVQQYLVIRSSGDENVALQNVPAGGVNDLSNPANSDLALYHSTNTVTQSTANASTVWGQDVAGNGGASSGSGITGPLGRGCASVRVFNASGSNKFGGVAQTDISLISWISVNDAITSRTAGASFCSFNGVSLDVTGNLFTDMDIYKVTRGLYSAWTFQQFYILGSASTETSDLYSLVHGQITAGSLGVAGIPVTSFAVGRSEDGGTINPFE